MPNAFLGRDGFVVDVSHVFLQGILADITLVGSGVGDGGARAYQRCVEGLPLFSVAITTLSGWNLLPSHWSKSPEGQGQAGTVPFKFFFLLYSCRAFAQLKDWLFYCKLFSF